MSASVHIAFFRASINPVQPNEQFTVSWETQNAREVYLRGDAVDASGSATLTLNVPANITLKAIGDDEQEVTKSIRMIVK